MRLLLLLAPLLLLVAGCSSPPASSSAGRQLFVENCAACHTLSDAGATGAVGPSLNSLSLSDQQLETRILNGGGGMPAFAGTLSTGQVSQLVDYLSSLSR